MMLPPIFELVIDVQHDWQYYLPNERETTFLIVNIRHQFSINFLPMILLPWPWLIEEEKKWMHFMNSHIKRGKYGLQTGYRYWETNSWRMLVQWRWYLEMRSVDWYQYFNNSILLLLISIRKTIFSIDIGSFINISCYL